MDTKRFADKLASKYSWRDGVITSPGKFEGESLATLYYYDATLDGGECVLSTTLDERRALGLKDEDRYVYVAESNDGSVSLEFYATREEAETRENEENEDYTDDDDNTACENVNNDMRLEVISDNDTYCPTCGSGETFTLGTLGKRLHFRCQACGMDYSHLPE